MAILMPRESREMMLNARRWGELKRIGRALGLPELERAALITAILNRQEQQA